MRFTKDTPPVYPFFRLLQSLPGTPGTAEGERPAPEWQS